MDTTQVPLGPPTEPQTTTCDADEIYAFALAINDENPLYLDGAAVPPTYAVVPVFDTYMGVMQSPMPPAATEGIRGGVHAEHDLYLRAPIVPGMRLHTVAERYSVRAAKPGMNLAIRLLSHDDAGNLVIEQYWSTMYLGEVTGGDHGPAPAGHTFPDSARDRPLGDVTLPTTRDQTFRYAGASGDRSVIHVSDPAAQQAGFPRKFNQGLCTLGIASKALVDRAAGGDPRRARRIAVRFASPTFPGDEVEALSVRVS